MSGHKALILDAFETVIEKPVYHDLWKEIISLSGARCPDPMTSAMEVRDFAAACGVECDPRWERALSEELTAMRLYPGVSEVLSECSNARVPVVIASNLAAPYGPRVQDLLGPDILYHFSFSSGRKKPDPQFLVDACHKAGGSLDRSLFIGNSLRSDYACGRAAGIRTLLIVENGSWEPHEVSRADFGFEVKRFLKQP